MLTDYNYISIEGNIGAGKTSLSDMLSKQLDAKLILERFDDNPFLPKFYENQAMYAFPLEMSFLAERYQQLTDRLQTKDLFHPITISDYFFPKTLIFAKNNLPPDEFSLFTRLFNIIYLQMPKPDLLVYLYVEVDRLKSNIQKRGRAYEQNISGEYLHNIQQRYFDYIKQQINLRVLILDINEIDFVNNTEDYELLLEVLNREWPIGINREIMKAR